MRDSTSRHWIQRQINTAGQSTSGNWAVICRFDYDAAQLQHGEGGILIVAPLVTHSAVCPHQQTELRFWCSAQCCLLWFVNEGNFDICWTAIVCCLKYIICWHRAALLDQPKDHCWGFQLFVPTRWSIHHSLTPCSPRPDTAMFCFMQNWRWFCWRRLSLWYN